MIPFRKSLAFRLLALSFILLALPLLVDSFVIIQRSYKDAIEDAKGYLVELARTRELPMSEMQPVKSPILILMEYALNLSAHFPQEPTKELNQKLTKMTEIGGLGGIFLLNLDSDNRFIIVGSSDPALLGWDYTDFIRLSDIYSPESLERGYFTYISYDSRTLAPYMLVGRVVYDTDSKKPTGIIVVSEDISQRLQEFLQPDTNRYTVNFALLLPSTVVFAASEPSLQYQYFEPLSEMHRKAIIAQEPFAKLLLPKKPITVSYNIGYPFFEFTWDDKRQVGYKKVITKTDYVLMDYAAKSAIYAAPIHDFVRVYGTYAAILIVGGCIAYLITRRMAKPLKSLALVMTGIQKGNLTLRYQYDPLGFEINLLGNIFNDMVDTLLQKTHLVEEERVKKETVSKELLIGQEVQNNLLPRYKYDCPGVELAPIYVPAKNVGGDFYIVFTPPDKDQLVLAIADASGKGVQACFYSLGMRGLFRTFIREYNDVARVMEESNRLFCQDTRDTGMFITALMGFYERKTQILNYYSCGHNPAMIRRKNGTVEILKNQDIAMGIKPLKMKQADSVKLESGDLGIFYTDGITEAHNEAFEQFGEHRLIDYLEHVNKETAQEIAEELVERVGAFVGTAPQHDDITLLIMRVL